MAKMRLTAMAVEKIKPPKEGRAEYFDDTLRGFHLRVTTKGKKTWNLTYRHAHKSRRMMLGTYPVQSLADAREKAREALRMVEAGIDPSIARQQDAAERELYTVSNVIELYTERYAKLHNRTWLANYQYLKASVAVEWGDRPMRDITRKDVHAYFDKLSDEGRTYSANNIFRSFRRLCNWAAEREIIDTSPCLYVKLPHKPESRDRTMSDDEIKRFWAETENLGYPFGSCLQLLMMTGQRRSEVAEMTWDEIDLDAGLWCLPKERSKNGKAHEVPLSPMAVELLKSLPRYNPPFVFSTMGGLRPIQGFSKPKDAIEASAELTNWRIHDIRRTVASQLAKNGTSRHVIEKILNHTDRSVTAIYDRHSYFKEKKEALESWAENLMRITQ